MTISFPYNVVLNLPGYFKHGTIIIPELGEMILMDVVCVYNYVCQKRDRLFLPFVDIIRNTHGNAPGMDIVHGY